MDDSQIVTTGSEVWTQAEASEPAGNEEAGEDLIVKIMRFIHMCWMRRRMVLSIVGAGILISLIYALLQSNVYTSTTSLMPPDNSSPYSAMLSMLSSSSSAASLGSEALGLNTPGELFVSILESRNVQDAVIARFDLVRYYKVHLVADARIVLASSTSIVQDRKSGIITIGVTDASPQLACKLAQGYVEELNRVVIDDSTSAARRERIFLEERVRGVKQDLDASSKALSQFSTKNKTIDISSQAKSMVDAGLKLQAELIDGRGQLAALRQTYSEDNYRVKAIEARNAELQRQLDAMGAAPKAAGAASDTGRSDYPSAGELPGLGLTYYDLERKVRVDEALWEALTKQYEMAKVEEAKQIPTVRVLDVANVPSRKSAPHRSIIVIIGTMLSFVIACLAVLVLSQWEEMDAEVEPKKTLTGALKALLSPQHWPWKLPGLRWIHRHLTKSGQLG